MGNCAAGFPLVPAVHKGTYSPSDCGTFYQYVMLNTEGADELHDYKCFSFNWTKINYFGPSKDTYQLHNTFTKKSTGELVTKTDFYMIDEPNDENYINIDGAGKIKYPLDVGRVIISKPDYYVDYSIIPKDNGECGYWWQIYGTSKVLSESDYHEAIAAIGNLGLKTDTAVTIDNINC